MSADWRESSWGVEFVEIDRLQEKMLKIPHLSEVVINEKLQNKVEPETPKEMREIFPMSKRNPQMPITLESGKKAVVGHAKSSESLKVTHENLGFTVRPKTNWRYLVFPDLGIGDANPLPLEFLRQGMERRVPVIAQDLESALEVAINKELGGN